MRAIPIKEIVKMTGGTLLQGDDSLTVTSVEHDSRQAGEGTLFVPIIGERVDGHQFIENTFEQGAVCTFTSRKDIPLKEGKAYLLVNDTLEALQKLAAAYRALFSIPIIGVTGSVGKTTTKEMIATVLDKKYNVLRTFKNLNSQIGLPMMMFYIEEDTDIAVIEMGISMSGEMERLAAIAKPCIAAMTNIGVSHIANLGSRENICREKGNIIREFEDGTLYLCGNEDYTLLAERSIDPKIARGKCEFVTYGTNPECNIYADGIETTEQEETVFTFHQGNVKEQMKLSVLGIHNVNNALVATAIGQHFEVPIEDIKEALYSYQPMDMRGNAKSSGGITVIDDTYNASSDSVASGLNVLYEKKNDGRKIAVLADIFELGEFTKEQHERIGHEIIKNESEGKVLSVLITVGTSAKIIADVVKNGKSQTEVHSFENKDDAISYLTKNRLIGDLYLIKGSRGMHMEEVCTQILSSTSQ